MDLKKVFVAGTGGFILVCLCLFYVLTNSVKSTNRSQRTSNIENVEYKLEALESAIKSHRQTMKDLEKLALDDDNRISDMALQELLQNAESEMAAGSNSLMGSCSSSVGIDKQASSGVNMLDVYEILKFDNPNGGAWKQGWDVQIDSSRFTEADKLKVFVIPHSHNDPGWIKTFEKYFEDQTRHILDSMLSNMMKNPSMKFIWAEISYFDLWWKGIGEKEKLDVKKLIERKQLEFVTGGWVMPDESSSHFYSILLQLTEGHQWLLNHLNYIPKNGWAIDPFGMSPTMAYFLRRTGLSNMLIQRTHYSVKKHLAKIQQLEFNWRQIWDSSGSTDIFCHMMPFYSYDVPHTCGPDPKVCCQFDFKRMRGVSNLNCPWNAPPRPVVTQNLRERSLLLLDQYKKKAMLYKTNTLLVPLGDDFRWENDAEWEAQMTNYQKIFDYINSQPDLLTEVKFGTLDDYFRSIGGRINDKTFKPDALSGDFFTYADRDDHYWSGYFTSRPFHKAMDRELLSHLSAAQLAFSLMSAEVFKKVGGVEENAVIRSLLAKLIRARRSLSLFQHHDGVAGTSKDHVMADYAEKLHRGLKDSNDVMQHSLHILSHLKDPSFNNDKLSQDSTRSLEPILAKEQSTSLPKFSVIILDSEYTDRLITVFNPIARTRNQLVSIYVSTYRVKVTNVEGDPIEFELLPVFQERTTVAKNVFQLSFVAELEPLEVKNFIVKHDPTASNIPQPEIYVKNSPSQILDIDKFRIGYVEETKPVSISNGFMKINFDDKTGFAESVIIKGKTYPFNIGMFKYGVKGRQETSGLYLFIPDGEATPVNTVKPFIKVVKGRFQSYVEVWLRQVKHRLTLYNYPGFDQYSVEVMNAVDIREERNFELMMRFQTLIKSGDTSYTDLNAFQMIRRKKFDKLPIQANYYPLSAATYIEDSDLRMTVLSRQPLGTASLSSGEIEVMMDRRLMQDDNRGAGQGDTDNVETINSFKVMFETPQCEDKESKQKPPMLSLESQLALNDLLRPFKAFTSSVDLTPSTLSGISDYKSSPSPSDIPCDIELVDIQMIPSYKVPLDDASFVPTSQIGVTVRRLGFDGRYLGSGGISLPKCSMNEKHIGRFKVGDLFGDLFQPKIKQMTLSFVHEGKTLSSNESILMKPMEIYAFRTNLQSNSLAHRIE